MLLMLSVKFLHDKKNQKYVPEIDMSKEEERIKEYEALRIMDDHYLTQHLEIGSTPPTTPL